MESVEKHDWNTVLQEGMMHETGDDVLNTAAIANKHYRETGAIVTFLK